MKVQFTKHGSATLQKLSNAGIDTDPLIRGMQQHASTKHSVCVVLPLPRPAVDPTDRSWESPDAVYAIVVPGTDPPRVVDCGFTRRSQYGGKKDGKSPEQHFRVDKVRILPTPRLTRGQVRVGVKPNGRPHS